MFAGLLGSGIKLTFVVNESARGKYSLDVLERRFAVVVDQNEPQKLVLRRERGL